jgi:hypothetical protein
MNQALTVQESMINVLSDIANESSLASNRMAELSKVVMTVIKKQNEMQSQIDENAKMTETILHRVNNLDLLDIKGTPRERLKSMVDKYIYSKGILHAQGWRDFKEAFNTAFNMNLKTRKTNYMKENGLKKLTYPEYLEQIEMIDDAIRVANKMLINIGADDEN